MWCVGGGGDLVRTGIDVMGVVVVMGVPAGMGVVVVGGGDGDGAAYG